MNSVFITPLDVLYLRGNQSFGDPGSYGESIVPPWPSVAAGAIRSRMLVDNRIDLATFARSEVAHPELGTPEAPGSFVLHAFHLARQQGKQTELLFAPPADLVLQADDDNVQAQRLALTTLHARIQTSSPLPLLPVLAQENRSKAASGWWLRQSGWKKYLAGQTPGSDDFIKTSELWAFDERVGVGLAENTRSADDGKLFTNRAVALKDGVGFVAIVNGAQAPDAGLLRLGGDGRAASIQSVNLDWPQPDYETISQQQRCRLVLTSPGLFAGGWLPNGFSLVDGGYHFNLHGVQGRLVAASVARNDVVSGWDLAGNKGKGSPKPAQRIAPAGSVYWLDNVQATPDALRKLVAHGLWNEACEDVHRRAEGFNRLTLAVY